MILIFTLKKLSIYTISKKKILNTSDDLELPIITKLIVEFYGGVKEIRNSFIETSALPMTLTELKGVNEDKIDFLQTILNNAHLKVLRRKKLIPISGY